MVKRGVGAKQQVIPISLNLLLISDTGLADEGPLHMNVKAHIIYIFIIKHHTLPNLFCLHTLYFCEYSSCYLCVSIL